jgi:hypothetical protein
MNDEDSQEAFSEYSPENVKIEPVKDSTIDQTRHNMSISYKNLYSVYYYEYNEICITYRILKNEIIFCEIPFAGTPINYATPRP